MVTSKMGFGFAVLIGLLFVSNTLGSRCEREHDGLLIKYVCTSEIDNDIIEISWKNFSPHGNSFELTQFTDNVPKAIKYLIDLSKVVALYEVTLSDSNITMLPSDLLTIQVENLKIIGNNIPSVNLNILPYANKNLVKFNISNNGIKEFETESTEYTSSKNIQTIDLSHNLIDHIPPNCFYSVRNSLQYLDLSYNQITRFDFYAFSSLGMLKSLRLSQNKLVQPGTFLYPLKNLRTLYLDHNEMKEVSEELFEKSTLLTVLDLSHNNIDRIDDRSFGALTYLASLNIGNNYIKSIKEILLRSNTRLESLNLSFNNLTYLEPGTFTALEKLNTLSLENAFAMTIEENMFTGLRINRLDFVGSTINKINTRPFISMGSDLLYLNLSSSSIQEVSETAFEALTNLIELDLSNNYLSEIAFHTSDLDHLSKLYLNNNSIRELKPESFQHLLSLTELDLSNNDIHTIPAMTFKNLRKLESLKILNNSLESVILPNTFFGLENIEYLELIHTKVNRWDSYALTGLNNLKFLNASHGQLSFIDYYAFTGTGNIEILDLSYNQINQLNFKLLPNVNMREIYLNNNQLSSMVKNSFYGFANLKILNLSANNLISIDSTAFNSLKSLRHLDLSQNSYLKIVGNIFHNLVLDTALLSGIQNHISFQSGTITIKNLDLSGSKISNVSSLHLHNIKGLAKLNLSQNNIYILDQFSFADNMYSLSSLSINNNALAHISPGTFFKTKMVRYLDVSHNKLEIIQFGALRGLENLYTLDLSNNTLYKFKLTLLYDIPSVSTILLDNNEIYTIGITDRLYALKKLSVGGNRIACDDLMDLKMGSNVTITAESLDYFTENIDGIPCNSFSTTYSAR